MRGKKKKGCGLPLTVLVGTGVALTVTAVLSAIMTGMILSEKIGEGSGEKLIYGLQLVGVFVGAETTKRISGTGHIRVPVVVAGAYMGITVAAGLLMEGRFCNTWLYFLSIGGGCLISCALCFCKTGRSGKRKKYI